MPPQPASPIVYKRRLLVFADILGWSELVCRSASDAEAGSQVAEAVTQLLDSAGFIASADPEDPASWRATVLSDSIAVSCLPEHAIVLLNFVAGELAMPLLRRNCYVRGAIVVGDLYHHANVIVGPALVRAVKLEKAACYPRVVVDRAVEEHVLGSIPEFLLEDPDGVRVFDYLRFSAQNDELLLHHTRHAREVVNAKLSQDADDPGLSAKHRWLLRYVEDVERSALERVRSDGRSQAP